MTERLEDEARAIEFRCRLYVEAGRDMEVAAGAADCETAAG